MRQRLAGSDMGEPTSANTAPYLMPFSTALSMDPVISEEYSFNNASSSLSDERRDSFYATQLGGWGGPSQRDERWCLQRIGIRETNDAFP